ncbi:MAG: hypothetical protein IT337_06300 [Thermomicrobiales bacterium]|nr:hypothetical protein [Thermomicrobiales bacterium]
MTDPRLRPATRWLSALLALAALLALSGLLWWRLAPDAPPPPPLPPPDFTTAPNATTLESALPAPRARAAAWLPEARLLNANLQIDWPWQVGPGSPRAIPDTGWITLVFLAPWQPPGRTETAASLSLVIERLSGQIVQQTTLGWETAALPAPTPGPTLTSVDAALAAERAGGTAFRRACPRHRHVSRRSLLDTPDFGPHWLIAYEDDRAPDRHGLLVRIDAAAGALLTLRDDAPACGKNEPPPR